MIKIFVGMIFFITGLLLFVAFEISAILQSFDLRGVFVTNALILSIVLLLVQLFISNKKIVNVFASSFIFIFIFNLVNVYNHQIVMMPLEGIVDTYRKNNVIEAAEQYSFANNTLYYQNQTDEFINQIEEEILWVTNICSDVFGVNTIPGVEIILFDDIELFQLFSFDDSLNGLYRSDQKTIYVLTAGENDRTIKTTLSHEYVHHYFYSLLGSQNIDVTQFPLWFHEGMATYISNINNSDVEYESYGDLSLKDLYYPKDWRQEMQGDNNPYRIAYVAVETLVELEGIEIFPRIVEEVKSGTDIYTAIEKLTDMPFGEFETILQDKSGYER
ncbi:hypothetical protein HMI01_19560 [Halolactibacillus miurensis]|uniref:Peptidase MA-like domain-containing protein n=1 Tax=Halolactibacillus miurensis TaxID=306541 RepID=A0A1I6T2D3_9BACI|nr:MULTISPECIES: hypothetical protein [Halolactibacillus]GEM04968.1 hypothetical protein HMI01_19560 [Halolactibacillus miurensis]SFS83419.1 hypothetical protein SAMN05421668_1129 [Halolactibacillus miurensis]